MVLEEDVFLHAEEVIKTSGEGLYNYFRYVISLEGLNHPPRDWVDERELYKTLLCFKIFKTVLYFKLSINTDKIKWTIFHPTSKKRFMPTKFPELFIDGITLKRESVS